MGFRPSEIKIGVLGGGQLGKMMAIESAKLDIYLHFLDPDENAPCSRITPLFTKGDYKNYDDVIRFGLTKDIITIEIEDVNIDALKHLQALGKKVYPQAEIIELIQNKYSQKEFFKNNGFLTAPFLSINGMNENLGSYFKANGFDFPLVQKSFHGGYDGKGVKILDSEKDLENRIKSEKSFVEIKAKIQSEVSVIIVRSTSGEVIAYPPVSMDFHPSVNLVEYLICPANIPEHIALECKELAYNIAEKLNIIGILAVEMFYNEDGTIWINELAPRPHNSGHHTLDNGSTNQFINHIRAINGLPLGGTDSSNYAIMVNLLGENSETGSVNYDGIDQCLQIQGVFIHLYGKKETKPFRKMGHATIVSESQDTCRNIAHFVKKTIKINANN